MDVTKLIPEQIMNYWPQIRECINAALPPHVKDSAESMLHIQEALLTGTLEAWLCHESGDTSHVYALFTTCFVTEEISRTKNLLVYTLATLNPHTQDFWQISLDIVRRYASSKNCANVLAYSNLPEVVPIAQRLGGDINWRMYYFSLT